ncbi:FAD-binding oxidoreductase [Arhodomonas sp. AD133]|uniref:FAD-binding oxidoreductase n=1 Tax=Arhodomonas sp. AD133 TaxID=3415009 RepID=UPI003EBAC1FF
MSAIACKRVDGDIASVTAADVTAFGDRLGGELYTTDTAGYEEARSLWNAMIATRPALIARCRGAADVIECVRFARERDLDFSVRGGGHNIAGTALCDDGLVIDLSAMHAVRAQPDSGHAWVQGGATWADVDRETQPFAQAVPSGIVTTTGVAGLTLGGGFGWLTRRFGLTCDHLSAVDMVTADARSLTVTPDSDPDLFWALRGGGGNFGIVTGFSFRTASVGPTVLGGMVVHDFRDARDVVALFRDFTAAAAPEVTTLLILRPAPPAPFLPESVHGKLIAAIAVCYAGPVADGEAAVEPVRERGRPLADVIAPKPFRTHQAMLDAVQPPGRHYYWKSAFLDEISDAATDTLLGHAERIASPHSGVLLMHLGGAARRQPGQEADPAVALRDSEYVLNIAASWTDPAQTEEHVGWARAFWSAMRAHSVGGAYVNFLTADEYADRVDEAYQRDVVERLSRVKRRFDPDNRLRHNANIAPVHH